MADGDYYASYADVKHILMNSNLGTSGNALWDDDAIEKALKMDQAKLHLRMRITTLTSLTDVVDIEVLKAILIHMQSQRILVSRHFNEGNIDNLETLQAFWALSPQITYSQLNDMKVIARKYHGLKIKNYDMLSGRAV